MPYYLFLYDRKKRAIVGGPWSYEDEQSAQALKRRFELEAEPLMTSREVVLLRAKSLDDLKTSHSHYFASPDRVTTSLRTLQDLTEVDRRVRMFTPGGLSPNAPMTAENALVYTQQLLGDVELEKSVPDELRAHFDVVVEVHRYGYFRYELFAVAMTQAALAWEHALGALFIRTNEARITLLHRKTGESASLIVSSYGQVVEALSREGAYPYRAGWRIEGDAGFDGSLYALFMWAWRRRLLRRWLDAKWEALGEGVRYSEMTTFGADRRVPDEYSKWNTQHRANWWSDYRKDWEKRYIRNEISLRNVLAHPTGHLIVTPLDSARAIRQLAEFINSVWSDNEARSTDR